MGRLFGTDGVRGIAGEELTAELACALGRAGAQVLAKDTAGRGPLILIGKDTRESGDMLEDGLRRGILSVGGTVVHAGVLPTPAVAWLTRTRQADAGIVISASHNPYAYNGIKFFNRAGFKLADAVEDAIEELVLQDGEAPVSVPAGVAVDVAQQEASLRDYANYLTSTMRESISGMKMVVDCANGAASQVAPRVFEALGAQCTYIGNRPDGRNINAGCGSTAPAALQRAVTEAGADIGLAFDGDADRLIAVDEKGQVVDGDRIMYACAKDLAARGELKENLLTATVMSNLGLSLALAEAGIRYQTADVGDRYVLELMQATGGVLGGEQSGHIIFLGQNTTGDGIYAALRFLEAVVRGGGTVSDAVSGIRIYPQVLVNARVKNENKNTYMQDAEIAAACEEIEKRFAGEGRVLIRPSGTEPLVRVMLEGADQAQLKAAADGLAQLIERKLG
ncbi:MAG: phosphoglucosamine mutase [Clostridiales Family XIII bacterium]|jgi:phosphoglucosamine mutase|nr:phosphoglucosamine mutase [Clostridiales Family XIII bacterium]